MPLATKLTLCIQPNSTAGLCDVVTLREAADKVRAARAAVAGANFSDLHGQLANMASQLEQAVAVYSILPLNDTKVEGELEAAQKASSETRELEKQLQAGGSNGQMSPEAAAEFATRVAACYDVVRPAVDDVAALQHTQLGEWRSTLVYVEQTVTVIERTVTTKRAPTPADGVSSRAAVATAKDVYNDADKEQSLLESELEQLKQKGSVEG